MRKGNSNQKVWHLWPALSDHCGLLGLSGFQIVKGNGLSFSGEKAQSEKLGQECFSNSDEEILNEVKIGFLLTVTQSLKGFLAELLSKVNDLPYSVGPLFIFSQSILPS